MEEVAARSTAPDPPEAWFQLAFHFAQLCTEPRLLAGDRRLLFAAGGRRIWKRKLISESLVLIFQILVTALVLSGGGVDMRISDNVAVRLFRLLGIAAELASGKHNPADKN
jgi:hypothetical protein